ncbi:MAG TPA: NADH-quinone oxidoreductase subunit NuoE [Alphaproteobacteria bacterium]
MKPRIAPKSQQPESFGFKDTAKVKDILSRYPQGREQSAIMPLLDLVMRQVAAETKDGGGWIPEAAMKEIARICNVSDIKVYEVATFYSMYILAPIGKHHIQCCTTTPCWLRGSADIVKACETRLGCHVGETTKDQMFTISEVECLGACVNAPMVQINDNYFEDLTPERMTEIIDLLSNGVDVKPGSQTGRHTSMSAAGATTLADEAKKAGIA